MSGRIVIKYNHFGDLAKRVPNAVGKIVKKTAHDIESDAEEAMEGPKHGRAYPKAAITKSYKPGSAGFRKWKGSGARMRFSGGRASVVTGYKIHRASAPGEAPAVDTGSLHNSISMEMTSPTTARVTVAAETGIMLEYGTRKMQMRPFMRPSAERNFRPYVSAMRNLETALK